MSFVAVGGWVWWLLEANGGRREIFVTQYFIYKH